MFNSKVNAKASDAGKLAGRARDASATAAQAAAQTAQAATAQAAQTAQAAAAQAAQAAQAAAQTAAQGIGKSVRQGVYTARGWAAPRLENAADYCTETVAPRVSTALRSTARQVSPDAASPKRRIRSVLSWPVLAVAVLAGAGAIAALVRKKYRAAMNDDARADDAADVEAGATESDAADGSAASTSTAPGESEANGTAPSHDINASAGLNGQVPASGR